MFLWFQLLLFFPFAGKKHFNGQIGRCLSCVDRLKFSKWRRVQSLQREREGGRRTVSRVKLMDVAAMIFSHMRLFCFLNVFRIDIITCTYECGTNYEWKLWWIEFTTIEWNRHEHMYLCKFSCELIKLFSILTQFDFRQTFDNSHTRRIVFTF